METSGSNFIFSTPKNMSEMSKDGRVAQLFQEKDAPEVQLQEKFIEVTPMQGNSNNPIEDGVAKAEEQLLTLVEKLDSLLIKMEGSPTNLLEEEIKKTTLKIESM